jgi:hypothetical protein
MVDITINETIDVVDITVNPNIIEVNVTRTSGGGGSQTLAQTLDNGNQTGGENILVNNADAIELENSSKLSQGIVDAGTGGNKGIALTCAVGFEWKFEAGEAYLTETNSEYIRLKQYARSLPSVNDDISKGFVNGSFWYLDSGIAYICTDPTNGAAVWEIYHNFIPTLQQVVNEGGQLTDLGIAFDSVVNPNLTAGISIDGLSFIDNDGIDEETTVYASNGIQRNLNANGTLLNFETPTNSDNVVLVPNGSGTLAFTSDIPAAGVPYTGATQNLDLGLFDLYTQEVWLYDGPNDNYGSLHYTDGNFHIEDGDGHPLFVIEDGFLQLHLSATIQSNLMLSNLTAIRDHYLPNESGTIALTTIVADSIANGVTDKAPSQNAVFDALALKQDDLFTFKNKGVILFDDFTILVGATAAGQTIGNYYYFSSGAGASIAINNAYPNRTNQEGVVALRTGTTLSGGCEIRQDVINPNIFLGAGAISYEVNVNVETLSTLAQRFFDMFGFIGNNNFNTTNGVYFLYDEGGVITGNPSGSANWKCVTISASTRTFTTTSVAVTASAWVKLRIEINAAATSVGFYINDVLVATHTTNIPTSSAPICIYNLHLKQTGLTSLTTYLDYIAYRKIFTSTR